MIERWLSGPIAVVIAGALVGSVAGVYVSPDLEVVRAGMAESGVLSAANEEAAAELARESGSEVLVDGATTSDSVTYALPDGTFRHEVTSGPTRIRRQGDWVDIDTSLVDTGGVLRPRAVPVNFAVSVGGWGPFAMLRSGLRSYGLSWPGKLPAPVVDGSTATYEGLQLPTGDVVDLTVTATKFGFTHAVVLRDRPKHPVEIRLQVVTTGGVELVQRLEGLLELDGPAFSIQDSSGEALATAAEPRMWDSSYDSGLGEPEHAAVVEATVEAGSAGGQELVLRPDPGFLADPDVQYPVVVDPDITRWPSTDTWIQNTHYSSQAGSTQLRAGFWNEDDCPPTNGCKARSFVKFDVSSIVGKQILDSDLLLWSVWASSCYADDGLQVRRVTTNWSSSSLTWHTSPQPSTTTAGAVVTKTRKGYNANCPDGYVEWDIDAIVNAWSLGEPNYGLRIAAANEADKWSWTKFLSANWTSTPQSVFEPRLIITYNNWPVTPLPGDLSSNPGGGCATSSPSPALSTTATPALTGVLRDADDRVGAEFEWYLGSTKRGGHTIAPVTNSSISSGLAFTATIPSGHFQDGEVIGWRVRARDDTATSAWSLLCFLRVDTSAPAPPILSSPDYPDDGVEHDGVGRWGYFDAAPGSADVVTYEYTFPGEAPLTVSVPAGDTARLVWTPYEDGTLIALVRSRDSAGNWSTYSSHTFRVKPGALPAAYWKLDETTGTVAAGVPGGCGGVCPDAALGSGAGWTTDGRVDGSLMLDGSDPLADYAATSGPVVDTTGSFTVAAWVRLKDQSRYQHVVSQGGSTQYGFTLYYSAGADKWAFARGAADTMNPPAGAFVFADATVADSAPGAEPWVHLVGVFDSASNEMRLYVNGVEQAEKDILPFATWNAFGPFQIGRVLSNGVMQASINGDIDEVRVYDRVLAPAEISQLATSAAVVESHWSFNEKSGTTSANNVAGKPIALFHDGADWNFEDPEFSWFWGASDLVLDEAGDPDPDPDNVTTDDGDSTTQDWVLDTDGSYSVGLWVFPYSLPEAGGRLPVVSQGGSLNSAFRVEAAVPPGDSVPRWALAIPQSDTHGAPEVVVWSDQPVRLFEPVHLMVTYNALDRLATLYVNGSCSRWDPATGQTMLPCAPAAVLGAFGQGGWVNIGAAYRDSEPSYFDGEIDEVRLYSGVVSQTEIAQRQVSP